MSNRGKHTTKAKRAKTKIWHPSQESLALGALLSMSPRRPARFPNWPTGSGSPKAKAIDAQRRRVLEDEERAELRRAKILAEKKQADPRTTPVVGQRASVPTPLLTDREKKILEIAKHGVSGLQYCRELERVGVRPRRKGVWHGAPSTYPAAYQLGKPWTHRIQDEKSKVRRKNARLVEIAKTRQALASE